MACESSQQPEGLFQTLECRTHKKVVVRQRLHEQPVCELRRGASKCAAHEMHYRLRHPTSRKHVTQIYIIFEYVKIQSLSTLS